jgi:hypothetical protein
MKQLLFTLSVCILLISACNTSKSSSKSDQLYIKTTTATGTGENQKVVEVISEVTSDYFEVSLSALIDGTYEGEKTIEESTSVVNYKYIFFQISDKDGVLIKFKESTEFLNFMSAHGYEMIDQVKNRYGGDYTFKKK